MDPPALVAAAEIGVVAAPGAAAVGKDQDALVVIHKGGGLGKIRRSGPGLDAQTVAALSLAPHDAPRTPGDLGDEIGAEAVQDLIECALHRRQ
jgi:hypothetical protein